MFSPAGGSGGTSSAGLPDGSPYVTQPNHGTNVAGDTLWATNLLFGAPLEVDIPRWKPLRVLSYLELSRDAPGISGTSHFAWSFDHRRAYFHQSHLEPGRDGEPVRASDLTLFEFDVGTGNQRPWRLVARRPRTTRRRPRTSIPPSTSSGPASRTWDYCPPGRCWKPSPRTPPPSITVCCPPPRQPSGSCRSARPVRCCTPNCCPASANSTDCRCRTWTSTPRTATASCCTPTSRKPTSPRKPTPPTSTASRRTRWPNTVGLLGGLGSAVTVAVALPNLSGLAAFYADPRAQFLAQRRLAAVGLEVLAIYHSHPGGGAVLSTRDLEFAAPWRVVQVVVAVARPCGRRDQVRAFRPGSPPVEVALQVI